MLHRYLMTAFLMLGTGNLNLAAASAQPLGTSKAGDLLAADEAAVARNIEALKSADSGGRAAAAQALRAIIARYPSGTTDLRHADAGRALWEARIAKIHPGMAGADARRILGDPPSTGEVGSGDSHNSGYRLDDNWEAVIVYRNPDAVLLAPDLIRSARVAYTPMPAAYTGIWTTYYVNGSKHSEGRFRNGAYEGELAVYYDNGRPQYTQHYRVGKAEGPDTGWYPDGKPAYRARYANGEPDGTWIHWYPNDRIQVIEHYKQGLRNGLYESWYDNGQENLIEYYINGVKRGVEASWKRDGTLSYRRVAIAYWWGQPFTPAFHDALWTPGMGGPGPFSIGYRPAHLVALF